MSDAVLIALIASIAPTLTVVCAYLTTRKAHRKVQAAVTDLGLKVNGRLEELLTAKMKEAFAAGHAAGVKLQRERGSINETPS